MSGLGYSVTRGEEWSTEYFTLKVENLNETQVKQLSAVAERMVLGYSEPEPAPVEAPRPRLEDMDYTQQQALIKVARLSFDAHPNEIEAIKLVRTISGLGLADAKHVADYATDDYTSSSHHLWLKYS